MGWCDSCKVYKHAKLNSSILRCSVNKEKLKTKSRTLITGGQEGRACRILLR